MQQPAMEMNLMHDAFWHNDQVVVTFYSDMHVTDFTKESAIKLLDKHRVSLNTFLAEQNSSLTLNLLSDGGIRRSTRETLRSASDAEKVDVASEPGIYLFKFPSEIHPSIPMGRAEVEIRTGLVSIFHIHDAHASQHDMAVSMPSRAVLPQEVNVVDEQKSDKMDDRRAVKMSPVVHIVNLINEHRNDLNGMNSAKYNVPILSAEPVVYCGATGDIPQGCPVSPPIPVPANVSCSSSPGLFPIELPPGLMPNTLGATGKGVTVCILDSLPQREQITRAAQAARENNKLLLDVEKNVRFNYEYDLLVDAVDKSGRLAVGKDIYGVHDHFNLADHGLFIAGIVRSLAPGASIECIRVLNDFCVGDMKVLLQSLQDIHNRMLDGGDLHGSHVVISMSLVIPTDAEAMQMGINLKAGPHNMIRTSLFGAIESLVALGAVFVASAGNEGDRRDNPSGTVPNSLYPAAFAEDDFHAIISVGAASSAGIPTTYSCFSGLNGIACYGGEIAKPVPSGCFTKATAIDALIGIYSSPSYPSLSVDDCEPSYPAPNSNAWAYWAGTSFATPIISAVMARILEKDGLGTRDMVVAVSNAVDGRPITWTSLDPATNPASGGGTEFIGRMIRVMQCKGEATE